jgi:hypothetical protein
MKKNCVKKLCKKKRQMLRNGYPRFLFHPIWHMTQPCTYFRCLWMSRQASFGSSIYYINNIGFCGFNRTHKTIKKLMKHTVSESDQKRTVQILRVLHVYTIANFIACLICTLIFLGCHCALIFLGCHSALIFLRCCWNLFRVASYWISYL